MNRKAPNSAQTTDLKQPPFRSAVLISGTSTGIGKSCAIELARAGFKVFAGYRRAEDAQQLQALSATIYPIKLDITQADSIEQAMTEIREKLDGMELYGLVNNAGIAVGGPMEFVPLNMLRLQLEVNVVGHIAVTQAAIPLLRKAKGRIVNIGSIAGLNAVPFIGPYSASKFALESLTDAMRIELQPWGIRVAIIEPGAIATPIWEKSLLKVGETLGDLPPEVQSLYGDAMASVQKAAMRSAARGLPPEHVAQAVLHALTAKRPRTRYLIGKDAKLRQMVSWLPDPVQDWLITQKAKLPGRNSKVQA